MPTSVNASFATFDDELNLDPRERDRAQKLHNDIRELLEDTRMVASTFLQGSFARRTMLKPLKDIDIVVLLAPELWERLRGPDGPGLAMELFKPPILRHWPSAGFDLGDEPAGKALRVTLPDFPFTIDLVPAFEGENGYVLVGDRHEGSWTPSNTRIQRDRVAARNVKTGGRFVHQVRELKACLKHHEHLLDFVKGSVGESLAHLVINRRLDDKHAMATVLRFAATAVLSPVIEPGGDDDVTAKWSPVQRNLAASVFSQLAAQAEEALRLEEAGDVTSALGNWRAILGDDFPAPPRRSETAVMSTWGAAGSVSSAGFPSRSSAAEQQHGATRAWSSR
jgi:hypothetical protein